MHVLVRLASEVVLKSAQVRARFQRQLLKNIAAALPQAQVHDAWSRIFVHLPADFDEEQVSVLGRIAGIGTYSIVENTCAPVFADIVALGARRYQLLVQGKTFAVRVKRSYKHAYTSKEIEIALGARLLPAARAVDLRQPDITVRIEVREKQALFFTTTHAGLGGLPLGCGGKAISLISGGFDSIVASRLLYERGVQLDYLFCNLPNDRSHAANVQLIVASMWQRYGFGDTNSQFYCLDFAPLVAEIKAKLAAKYWQVMLKRLFYRCAEMLANRSQAEAIVTGESLGQVSSQTLTNLVAINQSVTIPVLRPLLTYNKEQIIAQSRRMGVYAQCAPMQEYCQLTKVRPVTKMSVARAVALEKNLNLSLLAKQLATAEQLSVISINTERQLQQYRHVGAVPINAVLIDCRSLAEYQHNHHPQAQHRAYPDLLATCHKMDKQKTYIIYCDAGMQSTAVASHMQELGFRAYSWGNATGEWAQAQK